MEWGQLGRYHGNGKVFSGKMIRSEDRWQETEQWQGSDRERGQSLLEMYGSKGEERDGVGGQGSHSCLFVFLKERETWFGLQIKQKESVGRERREWLIR